MCRKKVSVILVVVVLLSSLRLLAQTAVPSPRSLVSLRSIASVQRKVNLNPLSQAVQRKPAPKVVRPKAPQPEPCWKVAGISPEAMARRRSIEQETHERVRQICADSSLSDQQKREQIRAVRQAANQEILGLTTQEQRAALKQCNQERAEEHAAAHPPTHLPRPASPNPRPRPAGPCGDMH
jgi:hypothetical protein